MESKRCFYGALIVALVLSAFNFCEKSSAHPRRSIRPRCVILNADTLKPIKGFNPIRYAAVIKLHKLPPRRFIYCPRATSEVRLYKGKSEMLSLPSNMEQVAINSDAYLNSVPLQAGKYALSAVHPPTTSSSNTFRVIEPRTTVPQSAVPPSSQRPSGSIPIPSLDQWRSNMLSFGQRYCDRNTILELSTWEGSVWYYDGIDVYQQIAEYTGDTSWYQCANYVKEVYRAYVLSSNGRVGGWRVFAQGLAQDWLRTNDQLSRQAVLALVNNSPFAPQGGGSDPELSRETAYLINADIAALQIGAARPAMLDVSVQYALSHLSQWQNSQTSYVKPFMVGLTMEALITYAEQTGDSRILPAVRSAADWMWNNFWESGNQKFPYIQCRIAGATSECSSPDNAGSADLNLLIAPTYAWLYSKTGEQRYQEIGDKIFAGGVNNAWLGSGKTFSQNYRSSIKFVRWRQ